MKHVLLVDDEVEIREILSQVLTAAGYRTSQASTMEEATQVVRHDPPHLILTDLQLEESDGFAVIEMVRQIAPGTPVVMLTGALFDSAMIRRFEKEHIASYIEKTSSLERILSEVKRHVGDGK